MISTGVPDPLKVGGLSKEGTTLISIWAFCEVVRFGHSSR